MMEKIKFSKPSFHLICRLAGYQKMDNNLIDFQTVILPPEYRRNIDFRDLTPILCHEISITSPELIKNS